MAVISPPPPEPKGRLPNFALWTLLFLSHSHLEEAALGSQPFLPHPPWKVPAPIMYLLGAL